MDALGKSYRFDCYNQGDGNEIAHDDHPTSTVCQSVDQDLQSELLAVIFDIAVVEAKICVGLGDFDGPDVGKVSQQEARYQLDHESCQNESKEIK